ncbi:hypothetical protein [Polyangium sp. 6x1]|uniref:hypothetical protein n=1 Tax=Polyangium sp. 6x1 TaxID=3042689 RepID=UPI002482C604|nr:hypothetical protein [Polyangium sp. 6x1]MDI1452183.1 hypothetical protein [Polyangium sp. 6x1]
MKNRHALAAGAVAVTAAVGLAAGPAAANDRAYTVHVHSEGWYTGYMKVDYVNAQGESRHEERTVYRGGNADIWVPSNLTYLKVAFYAEAGGYIGGDEWHAPPNGNGVPDAECPDSNTTRYYIGGWLWNYDYSHRGCNQE